MANVLDLLDFSRMDAGTQFKIFDRMKAEIGKMNPRRIEDSAMVTVALIIFEETQQAISENAGECEECNADAITMEWQEFDNVFVCGDCGHTQ